MTKMEYIIRNTSGLHSYEVAHAYISMTLPTTDSGVFLKHLKVVENWREYSYIERVGSLSAIKLVGVALPEMMEERLLYPVDP